MKLTQLRTGVDQINKYNNCENTMVTYSKKTSDICSTYNINNKLLGPNNEIKDLGVHIEQIVSSGNKILGFIWRNGKNVTNIKILKLF